MKTKKVKIYHYSNENLEENKRQLIIYLDWVVNAQPKYNEKASKAMDLIHAISMCESNNEIMYICDKYRLLK